MAYLYRKKFDIRELALVEEPAKKVLVVEPEEHLSALYAYHISRHNFFVRSCPQVDAAFNALADFEPHVCVLNAGAWGDGPVMTSRLQAMRRRFPAMIIVTVGLHTGHEDLKKFMESGVSAHLDRKLSRPADIVEIIKTLLI